MPQGQTWDPPGRDTKMLPYRPPRQRPKLGYTQTQSTRACRHMAAYTVQIIIKTTQEGKSSTNRKDRIISDHTWLNRPSHDRVPFKQTELGQTWPLLMQIPGHACQIDQHLPKASQIRHKICNSTNNSENMAQKRQQPLILTRFRPYF